MPPTKRALLIASPFEGLRGPLNDVETMAEVLGEWGFEISRCCGENATRQGILDAWRDMILASSPDDTVVVYYAGYGGIVEDDNSSDEESSFTSILFEELEHLLDKTTERTRNVTTIFDCSYLGRIARDLSRGDDSMPRNLLKHVACLRAAEELPPLSPREIEGNKHAVRISAAASEETAWEYRQDDKHVGLMTQALSLALRTVLRGSMLKRRHVKIESISWRMTMLRVRELVNVDCPQQNPHVAGPGMRLPFSLQEAGSSALVLRQTGKIRGKIWAGRVSGIHEGNVYALMPFGAQRPSDETQIGIATVRQVESFSAIADLSLYPGKGTISKKGILAFLVQEDLYRWPVACPVAHSEGHYVFVETIKRSKYLRLADSEQDSSPLVEFLQDGQNLILRNSQGVQLESQHVSENHSFARVDAIRHLFKHAEQLARAQHLQALTPINQDEKLNHRLAVTFGVVELDGSERIVKQDGGGFVAESDRVYILLKNNGTATVYVNVFDINVTGRISLISKSSARRGIKLFGGESYVLGKDEPSLSQKSLLVSWPNGVPKTKPVTQRLVLVLTDSPVDLWSLDSANTVHDKGRIGSSSLERWAFRLVTGGLDPRGDVGSDTRGDKLRYDIVHIPFTLKPVVKDTPTPLVSHLTSFDDVRELRVRDFLMFELATRRRELLSHSSYFQNMNMEKVSVDTTDSLQSQIRAAGSTERDEVDEKTTLPFIAGEPKSSTETFDAAASGQIHASHHAFSNQKSDSSPENQLSQKNGIENLRLEVLDTTSRRVSSFDKRRLRVERHAGHQFDWSPFPPVNRRPASAEARLIWDSGDSINIQRFSKHIPIGTFHIPAGIHSIHRPGSPLAYSLER
ncbi:hypothetical protein ACHAPT_004271 [Fusarium lateritium]